MLMENFGKKFVRGAKAEILEPTKPTIDWEKVIDAGIALLELGIFALAMFSGGKAGGSLHGGTVIVNNYIPR